MIATNYRKFPDALMMQRELELVFLMSETISELEMTLIQKTFSAGGKWIRNYAKKIASIVQIPAWFTAMRKRAIALAKTIKAAIKSLF